MTLPRYVDRGGEQCVRQPFEVREALSRAFVLPASLTSLSKVCDRYLHEPSAGRVRVKPLGPYAMLVFAKTARLCSAEQPDRGKGWISEIDVAFWIPVVNEETKRLQWFLPYVFVDTSYATAGGREIYGFPKSIATFQIPDDVNSAEPLTVDTLVLHPEGPDTMAKSQRIIEVRRAGSSAPVLPGLAAFAPLMKSAPLLRTAYDQFRAGAVSLPMLFLKQFRDVADPSRACYQAIVEAAARMTHVTHAGVLRGAFTVEITAADSHPIARELGLADKSTPIAQFFVRSDFLIDVGREVWRA